MAEKSFREQINNPRQMSAARTENLLNYCQEKNFQNKFLKIDLTGVDKEKEKTMSLQLVEAPKKVKSNLTADLVRDMYVHSKFNLEAAKKRINFPGDEKTLNKYLSAIRRYLEKGEKYEVFSRGIFYPTIDALVARRLAIFTPSASDALNANRGKTKRWTIEERAKLVSNHMRPIRELCDLIPTRTQRQIEKKLAKYKKLAGIKKEKKYTVDFIVDLIDPTLSPSKLAEKYLDYAVSTLNVYRGYVRAVVKGKEPKGQKFPALDRAIFEYHDKKEKEYVAQFSCAADLKETVEQVQEVVEEAQKSIDEDLDVENPQIEEKSTISTYVILNERDTIIQENKDIRYLEGAYDMLKNLGQNVKFCSVEITQIK